MSASPLPRWSCRPGPGWDAAADARRAAFARDGCLLIENFVPAADCDALSARADELIAGYRPERAAVFSTRAQSHAADAYFRESGDKIRFFFEPDAFTEHGALKQPKHLSINKIGHALHDLDPVFSAFSRRSSLARLAAELGLVEPLLLQSMLIFKQPRIGEEVVCHQDSTFLYTEPMSCIGLWFALEDADRDNGCLWAIPGRPALKRRFRYGADGVLGSEVFDAEPWPTARAQPLEVAKGSLIVLDGLLAHFSGPNHSERSRRAYTLHLIDGRCDYPADNWLRRGGDRPLRGF